MEKMTFEMAQHLFIRECNVKNLAMGSIISYKDKLKKLKSLLQRQRASTGPHLISADIIKDCIIFMKEQQKLKISTINTQLRGWRPFFNYLVREELIPASPFKKIKLLRQNKTIIQTFTDEQLITLLRQPKAGTFVGVRDYTIMLLLVETGVRLRELSEITVNDINWDRMSIRIQGKGNKERFSLFPGTYGKPVTKLSNTPHPVPRQRVIYIVAG